MLVTGYVQDKATGINENMLRGKMLDPADDATSCTQKPPCVTDGDWVKIQLVIAFPERLLSNTHPRPHSIDIDIGTIS